MADPNTPVYREMYERTWRLDGIEILRADQGFPDGRTVEAYAAVFDEPTEVHDQHGHYMERIHRGAFNRFLGNPKTAIRALCLYNHGMDLDGKPMAMAQVPLGTPLEIRADDRGLLTRTRYNEGAFTEQILDAIKNGDIQAQSFRGPIYQSEPRQMPKVRRGGALPEVTRTSLGLSDYGPTPRPFYPGAAITAVRSATALAADIAGLGQADLAELIRALSSTAPLSTAAAVGVSASPDGSGLGAEDSDALSGRRIDIRRALQRVDMTRLGVRRNGA